MAGVVTAAFALATADADGNLAEVSNNLTVAFSAVILALIAASITYWVVNVRRRWLAEELLEIEGLRGVTLGAKA